MSYLPLARKYRPQTFEDLIGQPHVTETLARALKTKRLGQAYLFAGQRGVGKTSAARILAKCLNCEQEPKPTPCNRCASCTQITEGRSLDVIEIDGASNRGIDEIRALRDTVAFAPTMGAFRVYIIDEVHMLTLEAFNALLKTLEEPPAHVRFIFATTAPGKVPATILSRCQRFDFRRLEVPTLVAALTTVAQKEQLAIEEPALYAVARAAEGSLRDAEVILEQLASFVQGRIREADVTELLGAVGTEALFAWAQAIVARDPAKALEQTAAQLAQGRDPTQLLADLLHHVRNLLVVRSVQPGGSTEAVLARLIDEPSERIKRLGEQAGHSTAPELLLMLQILISAYDLARRSPTAQTILELAVLKLATRDQWASLEDISRRLKAFETAAPPPVVATPRPGPKPAEAPEPAARGESVALEEVLGLWSNFLERLGAQRMSLAAYLAHAKPLAAEGRQLTIGLEGFALHHEVLTAVENHRLIERLLGELCGGAVAVQYTTLPPTDPTAPPAGEPSAGAEAPSGIVHDIVKLFNATVIDRPSQNG